jgi:hypothetical protein
VSEYSKPFFQRYDNLYNFWLVDLWTVVSDELMRKRPHPKVNSIAWNLWHLTRVEDAGLSRFVADRSQVFDEGGWLTRLNIPWRYMGSGMTFAEVDEMDKRIDIQALQAYSGDVQARTREIVSHLDTECLDEVWGEYDLQKTLFDEGLTYELSEGILKHYLGWTKNKCLFNFGMTHPYQHVGEIGVIASLLGVEFD